MVLQKIPTFEEVKSWVTSNSTDEAYVDSKTSILAKQEKFSVTTDTNGQASVSLSHPIEDVDNVAIFVQNELRIADFVSLSTGTVTFDVRIVPTSYERASSVGGVTGQPSGVSIANAVTSTTTQNTSTKAAYDSGRGRTGYNYAVGNHTHEVTHIYQHSHSVSNTVTELQSNSNALLAGGETIDVVISYV